MFRSGMYRNILLTLLKEEEDDEEILFTILSKRKRRKIKHIYTDRDKEDHGNSFIKNHLLYDEETYRQFFRLNKKQVDFVLSLIENNIKKTSSRRVKYPISPVEKLLLTLRFLTTGETFRSLSVAFKISYGYISIIVRDVLRELYKKLVPIFLPEPQISDFEKIANDFTTKCNFPNCIGVMDGKHVRVLSPKNSGSLYSDRHYFSIVLLALIDTNCKFVIVDIGSYGEEEENGIFEKSIMGRHMRSGEFRFPVEKSLPASDIIVPHVIIADEAFRLSDRVMKPYPKDQVAQDTTKAVFNDRLCKARKVSESAFVILCQNFRILSSPIAVLPETTNLIITATCCFHNMLRDEYLSTDVFQPDNHETNASVNNMLPLARSGDFSNADGFQIRDKFRCYFNTLQGSIQCKENSM